DFAEKIEYEIATAWVMHTWRMENWKCTPYLFFFGPPASGKTWAMEVLGALAYRPMMTFPSPAAVYRTTEEWHPTFFLDEVQMYLQRTEKADIINYLNAGYRRGQTVIRMEENPQTKRLEPVPFEVFGPKCLAGTIGLLETLKTRCFTIVMSRAVRHVNLHLDAEQIDYFRSRLFTYRLDCLSENSDIIDMLQFSEKYKEITDGRLKELVFPLYEVAPTSCKELFAELLFKLRGELLEEEALSIEAIIFSALVTAHKERPLIPLSDVATAVNELITSTAEWIDNKTIGHIISKLGFNKMRYKNRTHIIWDDNIAVRLLKRYPTRREEE
ncbi:MAG: hypothetical protein OEY81_07305, partial [Candidatus Bathyarchaeota archaeon]|nr:hypothetical protein [Candidatus Bathyarchaeota archaeon]